MKDSLVSVIIPLYNVSEYLDGCVQSACDQTYQNLEIILVDDGSPDDCPAKCDAWAQKDRRIKVIHKKNGGLSDARNAGLDIAKGKYIYFLDGDDSMKRNLIETVMPHMEAGVDLVVFNYDQVEPNGTRKPTFHDFGNYTISEGNRVEFYFDTLLSYKIGWEAWNRFFRRDLIETNHIRFADNNRIFAEDLYFSLCYCSHVNTIVSLPDSLYNYTVRENSIMGQNQTKLNAGRMNELAKAVMQYFQKCGNCGDLIEAFPAMHYLIIENVLSRSQYTDISTRREMLYEDISDWDFYRSSMKRLLRNSKHLLRIYPKDQMIERLCILRYYLDNNFFAFCARNKIRYKLQSLFGFAQKYASGDQKQQKYIRKQQKKLFIIGTEEYGNIGDHQINESTVDFLKKILPGYTIYEITTPEWTQKKNFWIKCIQNDDLIVCTGGGNFGNTYPLTHNVKAELIQLFPKNPKIIFPQTLYYTNCENGREMLARDKTLFTKENNVVIAAREKISYEMAKSEFSCLSILVPDIVLYTMIQSSYTERKGVLLCLRSDIEKAITEADQCRLESICTATGLPVSFADLQLEYNVRKAYRRFIIDEKFRLFQSARIVVTDRLHGLIFATITGTPCIVLSNFNQKVKGTYDWICHLPYIRFAESVDDVAVELQELLEIQQCHYDPDFLQPYYKELESVVKQYASN